MTPDVPTTRFWFRLPNERKAEIAAHALEAWKPDFNTATHYDSTASTWLVSAERPRPRSIRDYVGRFEVLAEHLDGSFVGWETRCFEPEAENTIAHFAAVAS